MRAVSFVQELRAKCMDLSDCKSAPKWDLTWERQQHLDI